jgi:hypothetical protein
MTMRVLRSCLLILLLTLPCAVLLASTRVEFDRIGPTSPPDSAWVEGLNGFGMYDLLTGSPTQHMRSGIHWVQSVDAKAQELRFAAFNPAMPSFDPDDVSFDLHLWLGVSSFSSNSKTGDLVIPGSQINFLATPLSATGPTGADYPTWQFRLLLSELPSPMELQTGQAYVMAPVAVESELVLQFSNPPQFIGQDDVYAEIENDSVILGPGFIKDLASVEFRQFGAALTVAPLIPGDYDFDGDVDDADYDKWKDTYGSMTDLMADGNDNGVVDVGDYNVWRNHLGSMTGGGSLDAVSVPEPIAVALAALAIVAAGAVSARPKRAMLAQSLWD